MNKVLIFNMFYYNDVKKMTINEPIEDLINKGKTLNIKVFNLNRYILLSLISHIRDGVQFRELKAALDLSDGNLYSNIHFLIRMGMISAKKTQFDNKEIEFYTITKKGIEEIEKFLDWVESIKILFGENNE